MIIPKRVRTVAPGNLKSAIKDKVDVGKIPMRVEIGVVVLQHVDETVKHDDARCQHKNEQRRLDKVRQDTKT